MTDDELLACGRISAYLSGSSVDEVGLAIDGQKTIMHPEFGEITVDCQMLWSENRAQSLLVFTARPGTVDYDKIAMLPVTGHAQFTT